MWGLENSEKLCHVSKTHKQEMSFPLRTMRLVWVKETVEALSLMNGDWRHATRGEPANVDGSLDQAIMFAVGEIFCVCYSSIPSLPHSSALKRTLGTHNSQDSDCSTMSFCLLCVSHIPLPFCLTGQQVWTLPGIYCTMKQRTAGSPNETKLTKGRKRKD